MHFNQWKINQSISERSGKFYSSQIEDYDLGRCSQKASRTILPTRSQSTGVLSFLRQRAVPEMTYYWQFTQFTIHIGRYSVASPWPLPRSRRRMLSLRSCPVGIGRMLLFMAEQVFLPMGKVCSVQNEFTQCAVLGREEAQGQRNFYVWILLILP